MMLTRKNVLDTISLLRAQIIEVKFNGNTDLTPKEIDALLVRLSDMDTKLRRTIK